MRLWPFRGMIIRGGAAAAASAASQGSCDGTAAAAHGVPQEPLFHFGEATMQRQALDMTNRLTGCATKDGSCSLCTPLSQLRLQAIRRWKWHTGEGCVTGIDMHLDVQHFACSL